MKDLTIRINDDHIKRIARRFGIEFNEIVDTIDSSHGEGDVRINCILDNKYVLKINTEAAITEARLAEIAGLIERYSAIGVYCPMLQRTVDGSYSTYQEIDGHKYICYAEEFANYELGNNDIKRAEIIEHLGILAARYSDVKLASVNSMWSLIDLVPLDTDIDEKAENVRTLIETLNKVGYNELAIRVKRFDETTREAISADYKALPRCVYQGDLNGTNILSENGHFKGLIDFNLSGTEGKYQLLFE